MAPEPRDNGTSISKQAFQGCSVTQLKPLRRSIGHRFRNRQPCVNNMVRCLELRGRAYDISFRRTADVLTIEPICKSVSVFCKVMPTEDRRLYLTCAK